MKTKILVVLLVLSTAFGCVQSARLTTLQYDVAEGNKTSCDDGYVAKIVDGRQVTCVMLRVGPGMVTHRVAAKRAVVKNVTQIRKENKNEIRKDGGLFYIGKLGDRMH